MGMVWGELPSLGTTFGCCVFMLRGTETVPSLEKCRLKGDRADVVRKEASGVNVLL